MALYWTRLLSTVPMHLAYNNPQTQLTATWAQGSRATLVLKSRNVITELNQEK